jgi:ribosome-binding factor A
MSAKSYSRGERVAKIIKQEVSQVISEEIKDPRVGFVTITRVELSEDLKYATVYFSLIGDTKAKEKALRGLESASGYVRKLVGGRLSLRYTPEIIFRLDKGVEYSFRVDEVLHKIKSGA